MAQAWRGGRRGQAGVEQEQEQEQEGLEQAQAQAAPVGSRRKDLSATKLQ